MIRIKINKTRDRKKNINIKPIAKTNKIRIRIRARKEKSIIENMPLEKMFNKNKKKQDNKETDFLISSKNRKRLANPNIAECIIKESKIICVNEKLYLYNEELGYYNQLSEHLWKVVIRNFIPEDLRKFLVPYDIKAIYELIKMELSIQVKVDYINSEKGFINCDNVVLDLKNKRILEHDSKYYFTNVINAKYKKNITKEDIKCSCFYKFLNDITQGDKELRNLLKEIIGYSISGLNNGKKFFIFYGQSNSGKSVILDLLSFLCGERNVSNIPLQKLSDEKHVGELFGKVLNIYNELPDNGIKDTGTIKSLVSDTDKTTCRPIYSNPFSFKNKATLIFATNNYPSIESKLYQDNTAFFNRVIIVPFIKSIPESEQDKDLIEKLKKEKNIIFKWALDGIDQYIDNGYNFSKCTISQSYLNKYKNSESLVELFIKERVISGENLYIFNSDLMDEFELFCNDEGVKRINSKEKKYLKDIIKNEYKVEYKKIHRNGENKYGFWGITLKD